MKILENLIDSEPKSLSELKKLLCRKNNHSPLIKIKSIALFFIKNMDLSVYEVDDQPSEIYTVSYNRSKYCTSYITQFLK